MRTPSLSRQSIAPRLLLSLTLALSLLFATASSVLADGHEGTLSSSGGTIEFASGVTVNTPDGASSSDVIVTYTALEEDAIPGAAPDGTMLGSLVFTLDTGGAVFKQLAKITIPYTAEDEAAAKDGRAENVHVYSWDPVSGSWLERLSAIPDVLNKAITVSDTTLGTYAIVITLPDEPVETPTPLPPPPPLPPQPDPVLPDGGDYGVGNGMMMGLALLGMLFLMGGGYVLVRNRR